MLRKVRLSDAQRIREIYNYYIANTVHTFETETLTEEQVKKRIQKYADSSISGIYVDQMKAGNEFTLIIDDTRTVAEIIRCIDFLDDPYDSP